MLSLYDQEAIRRLQLPGKYSIVMVLLKKDHSIDEDIMGLPAEAAVRLSWILFETGEFEYIRVFGPDGSKVINYSLEN